MRRNFAVVGMILLASIGALVSDAVLRQHQFNGEVFVQICDKDDTGHWQIVDEIHAPLGFSFSLRNEVKQKGLSSDFIFSGRSKQGFTISARLKTGAEANYDPATGIVTLALPLGISVDGNEVNQVFKFTTETESGIMGPISGRRLKIDDKAHTAQLVMISSTTIPAPQDNKKELLVVIRGDGTIKIR